MVARADRAVEGQGRRNTEVQIPTQAHVFWEPSRSRRQVCWLPGVRLRAPHVDDSRTPIGDVPTTTIAVTFAVISQD